MRKYLLLALLFGFGGLAASSAAVDPARVSRLTAGINLSHWFAQQPRLHGVYAHDWLRTYDRPADFALLAHAGFRHVRWPVEFEMFLDDQHPGELRADYLADFDAALDEMLNAGLAVIVDWHAREDTKDRLKTDDAFVATSIGLWQAMARHLANRDPQRVFLEIMNEPSGGMSAERWYSIQNRMLAAIRAEAPQHTIIVAGARWSGVDDLTRLTPVADGNVVYNFHFYEPMVFTHQTAAWPKMGLEPVKGLRYPMDPANRDAVLAAVGNGKGRQYVVAYKADRAWIAHRLDEAAAWGRKYGVPVTCNEFGVYRVAAPPADRYAWLHDVRSELEANHLGWTMWDYAGGFGVSHDETPGHRTLDPECLQALGVSPR